MDSDVTKMIEEGSNKLVKMSDVTKDNDVTKEKLMNDDDKLLPGNEKNETGGETIKVYGKRWLVLGIFCLYSMSSAFQWIEYSILTSVVTTYWSTTVNAISWTSMLYMATYIPLMFVATWVLDTYGLRKCLIIGSLLNSAGSVIKLFSVHPDNFYISFIGQTVAACAQSFILEIPAKIASLWFESSKVSTATSIGVFGNQLGVAFGFLIPPLMVPSYSSNIYNKALNETTNETIITQVLNETAKLEEDVLVESGLRSLFWMSASICVFVTIMIILVISDEPAYPPSKARARSKTLEEEKGGESPFGDYFSSLKCLLTDFPFVLLFLSYGINTGVYYAIGTLLNPLMMPFFKDVDGVEATIGLIGLVMVIAGLLGSAICGVILDKTKAYKATAVVIYASTLVFIVVFAATLDLGQMWINFISIGLLGFFMTGYLPIGFEVGAEITYPISEATSSGLLNVSAQVFGIAFTSIVGDLIYNSVFTANMFMIIALVVGTIMTVCMKCDLKRQQASKKIISLH